MPARHRVLLVVDHRRNEELLAGWASTHGFETTASAATTPDLVIADGAALRRRAAELDLLRERELPAYIPILLVVSPRTAGNMQRDLWRLVDEVLMTPVRMAELGLRIGRLLELRERSVAVARRLEELGRSNVDLEQFAYVAAHELSTPLGVVTGALETISARYRGRLDPKLAPLLDAADRESERLHTLIHDLLAFSRAGRGLQTADLPLDDLVAQAIATLDGQIRASGAAVESDRLPRVFGDRRQLQLVLTNLIGNAIKYRAPDRAPRIRITSDDGGDEHVVSVRDNGRGVAPEREHAIFEMFERADGGAAARGHGIGLALCRRIIERHDGRLWVEPAPGHGSVFRFALPKR